MHAWHGELAGGQVHPVVRTCSMWPVRVRRRVPLAVSQILIVRSAARSTGQKQKQGRAVSTGNQPADAQVGRCTVASQHT